MSGKRKEDLIIIILLVFLAVTVAFVVNIIGPTKPRSIVIQGDGCGHYDYLPAIFVYHSVDFTPVFQAEKQRHGKEYFGHYFHKVNGVFINKYTSGTALMILPFFLFSWLFSLLWGYPLDGFNVFFQYSPVVAAIFWIVTGLWFFIKLLLTFGIKKKPAFLFGLMVLFGTNLFVYTFITPAFSHVYSFAVMAMLLFTIRKYFLLFDNKYLYLSAYLYGLLILIRPVNAIALFVLPLLADSTTIFFKAFRYATKPGKILLIIFFVVFAFSPQIIITTLQTGKPFIYGYANEGFYFAHPQIINFLFSYRKGWFVYTPLMLLLFPAIIYFFKKNCLIFWIFVLFFALQVYLFSSWWNWFYGDSFGMRPMIDFYALFMLLISIFITKIKNRKILLIAGLFIAFSIFLNLFQSYQYAEGIIHPDSMNKKAYWYVFLKGGSRYKYKIKGEDESFYGKLDKRPYFTTENNIDNPPKGWQNRLKSFPDPNNSSNKIVKLSRKIIYSPTFVYYIPKSMKLKNNFYIIFNTRYYELSKESIARALFVVDISNHSKKTVFYKTFSLERLPGGDSRQWKNSHIGFKLPEIQKSFKKIKFYIWNMGKGTFYLDDLKISFYQYRRPAS